MSAQNPHLVVLEANGLLRELGRVQVGGLLRGLREDSQYQLAIEDAGIRSLYIDDVPLVQESPGKFSWSPGFFAGRVEVVATGASGIESLFFLEVSPATHKVSDEQFGSMIAAIRAFDEQFLLGNASSCLSFGRNGTGGRFDMHVRWERMRKHGSSFLECVAAIVRTPHANLKLVTNALPLARVKRLPTQAMRDRRIIALAAGQVSEGESVETIQVQVQVPTVTVDTPANRALCALLNRFRQSLLELKAWVESDDGELSKSDAIARRNRRLGILRTLESEARRLFSVYPFKGVSKAETTSAGLTQISANPLYARAYRTGTDTLRVGTRQDASHEFLHVGPSWGVYETWCYVEIVDSLTQALGTRFSIGQSVYANADVAMHATLPDGRRVELLFQATFPSVGLESKKSGWSLSRERRPDITVVVIDESGPQTFIFDSKYRSGRANVLDAMASAHIYHDALYLGGRRPDYCLLLLPADAGVASLTYRETWQKYGVGTISEFSVGGEGVSRCVQAITEWLQAVERPFTITIESKEETVK